MASAPDFLYSGVRVLGREVLPDSEAEPHLQLDYAAVKSALRLPKLRITGHTVVTDDVPSKGIALATGAIVEPLKVELVEDVKKVSAEFESRILAENRKLW